MMDIHEFRATMANTARDLNQKTDDLKRCARDSGAETLLEPAIRDRVNKGLEAMRQAALYLDPGLIV